MRGIRTATVAAAVVGLAVPALAASDDSSGVDPTLAALANVPGVVQASDTVTATSDSSSAIVTDQNATTVEVPKDPSAGVTVDPGTGPAIQIGLPGAAQADNAQPLADGIVAYQNAAPATTVVAQALPAEDGSETPVPEVAAPAAAATATTADPAEPPAPPDTTQTTTTASTDTTQTTTTDSTPPPAPTDTTTTTTDSSSTPPAPTDTSVTPPADPPQPAPLALGAGIRLFTVIASADAPTDYSFPIGVPEGGSLQQSGNGYRIEDADGVTTAVVTAPWAKDADGNPVPVMYSLDGTALQVHVDTSAATFPVVVDPKVADAGASAKAAAAAAAAAKAAQEKARKLAEEAAARAAAEARVRAEAEAAAARARAEAERKAAEAQRAAEALRQAADARVQRELESADSTSDASVPSTVLRYAPLVWLDKGERYFPAHVRNYFLRYSELKFARPVWPDRTTAGAGAAYRQPWRLGRGPDVWSENLNGTVYRANQFTRPFDSSHDRNGLELGSGFFLNLLGTDHRAGERDVQNDPVYYEYQRNQYVTYWFFYAYDDGYGPWNHEGDWEHISIKLGANDHPDDVYLYRHNCHVKLAFGAIGKVFQSDHPIVYSARGVHGSYAEPGSRPGCGTPSGTQVDYTSEGTAWPTWDVLVNARSQPWYGFGGAWGQIGSTIDNNLGDLTTGPLGPSPYKDPAPHD